MVENHSCVASQGKILDFQHTSPNYKRTMRKLPRNWVAVSAFFRRSSYFDDRREPRAGTKNQTEDFLEEEEINQTEKIYKFLFKTKKNSLNN